MTHTTPELSIELVPNPSPKNPLPVQPSNVRLNSLLERGLITQDTYKTIQDRLNNLPEDQLNKALNVIETNNNPEAVHKCLKGGGIALLAKLDGLDPSIQKQLLKNAFDTELYLVDLNKLLDKYHSGELGPDRDKALIAFIDGIGKLKNAAYVSQLMSRGDINKILSLGGTSKGTSNQKVANTPPSSPIQPLNNKPTATVATPNPSNSEDKISTSNFDHIKGTNKFKPEGNPFDQSLVDYGKAQAQAKETDKNHDGSTANITSSTGICISDAVIEEIQHMPNSAQYFFNKNGYGSLAFVSNSLGNTPNQIAQQKEEENSLNGKTV